MKNDFYVIYSTQLDILQNLEYLLHFLGQKSDNPSDIDYIPSVFDLKKTLSENSNQQRLDRQNRLANRQRQHLTTEEQTVEGYDGDISEIEENPPPETGMFFSFTLCCLL